jgi:hypothetical protein
MFHSSTTIYRFPKNTAFASGERRMVYGVLGAVKSAVTTTFSVGKTATVATAKYLNRNPIFRFAFAPFYWAGKGVKWGYEGTKYAAYQAEFAARTGIEAAKGLAWKSTTRPALTLGLSALRDVKMCLWDLPISVLKGMIRFPIALARSPLELVRGVRDSIVSVPKNVSELYKNLTQLDVRKSISSLFKLPKDIIAPPIARPLGPMLAPAANVISTAARSKLQYLFAMKDAGSQVVDGVKYIRNARQAAAAQMAAVTAERLERKKKAEEEKEMEKQENMQKVKELKGGKGGKTSSGYKAAA